MPKFSADYLQNDVVSLVCRHQGRQATDQGTTWADRATDQAPGHTTRAGHTTPIRPPITTPITTTTQATGPAHHPAPRPQATSTGHQGTQAPHRPRHCHHLGTTDHQGHDVCTHFKNTAKKTQVETWAFLKVIYRESIRGQKWSDSTTLVDLGPCNGWQ
jgi:hypothetical protein